MSYASTLRITLLVAIVLLFSMAPMASSQDAANIPAPPVTPVPSDTTLLTDAQIQALVAPIALYPDPLIAQILPASTYPIQVVLAVRWLQANPNPTETSIDAQSWEPSIKAMLHYPTVLTTMNDRLDWTQSLGVAFLNQQADVMNAIQELRLQAQSAGSLQSTPQQQVVMNGDAVEIVPVDPNVICVPQYDPNTVYLGDDGTSPYLLFGVGYPEGPWLDNNIDWRHHWVSSGNGWHQGWGNPRDGGLRPGEGAPITRPWARDQAQPLPVRARSSVQGALRGVRPGYENSKVQTEPLRAFQNYQNRSGVQRAVDRAQQSRPVPQARSAPRAAPVQAFRAEGNGRSVAAQSARGQASRGASRGGGGGGGGGGGRGGGRR